MLKQGGSGYSKATYIVYFSHFEGQGTHPPFWQKYVFKYPGVLHTFEVGVPPFFYFFVIDLIKE